HPPGGSDRGGSEWVDKAQFIHGLVAAAVIGVDEAQFIHGLVEFSLRAADHDGKTLFIAGLDGDFR
ncbi:unnamed protein product, partial [Closterium sp. Naga37s-1]